MCGRYQAENKDTHNSEPVVENACFAERAKAPTAHGYQGFARERVENPLKVVGVLACPCVACGRNALFIKKIHETAKSTASRFLSADLHARAPGVSHVYDSRPWTQSFNTTRKESAV